MYVIVVGGGKVGYYLTKELIDQSHEVLIVEKERQKAARIAEELGSVVMRGDGCEAATLAQAGAGRADVVIAVTGDDEDNLVVCQLAKAKFNVRRTIARINNPKNEGIFRLLGVDVTVSHTDIILSQIEERIDSHPLLHLMRVRDAGLEVVEADAGCHLARRRAQDQATAVPARHQVAAWLSAARTRSCRSATRFPRSATRSSPSPARATRTSYAGR